MDVATSDARLNGLEESVILFSFLVFMGGRDPAV
jgi:hypothetical protein